MYFLSEKEVSEKMSLVISVLDNWAKDSWAVSILACSTVRFHFSRNVYVQNLVFIEVDVPSFFGQMSHFFSVI